MSVLLERHEQVCKEIHVITKKIHNEYSNVLQGLGCFEGAFTLWVIESTWPYQVAQVG